jgi:hypothetical protein
VESISSRATTASPREAMGEVNSPKKRRKGV